MMKKTDPFESMQAKVDAIFRPAFGARSDSLHFSSNAKGSLDSIAAVLKIDYGSEKARDIAFHLCDWNGDAAFLVAMHLFPERFSAEEIKAGIDYLISHVANHAAAAAKLYGEPVQDVWDLGVLDREK